MAHYRVRYSGRGSTLGKDSLEAVARTLRQDTLAYGPKRQEFERAFAAYVGTKYALTTNSCTTALYLAADVLGLGSEDEVITTPQTFWATIRPLQARGVRLRFADIDSNSLNIAPDTIEPLVTANTRAIFLVHMGGLPADMNPIMAIAERHGLYVVEDCAHATGATYEGRRVGGLGHVGCFSFHSVKNMSTLGEGGMITFNSDAWADRIRPLRSIGAFYKKIRRAAPTFGPYSKPHYQYGDHSGGAYDVDCDGPVAVGSNYRMSEPAAAVGLVQLRHLDSFNERRRDIASRLNEGLRGLEGVRVQEVPAGYSHAHHLFVFFYQPKWRGSNIEKDELIRILHTDEGIEVVNRYFPLHLLPELRALGHNFGDCRVAERVWFEEHVNLPIYPELTDSQVQIMIDSVKRAIGRVRGMPREFFLPVA